MYIVGQERRLVDPPSQVVAGVRTVTTKNEWARRTPTLSRPFALFGWTRRFVLSLEIKIPTFSTCYNPGKSLLTRRATAKEVGIQLQSLRVRLKRQQLNYQIHIGRDLRRDAGEILRSTLGQNARRIAVISDQHVFSLYGPEVIQSLRHSGFPLRHWLMSHGER